MHTKALNQELASDKAIIEDNSDKDREEEDGQRSEEETTIGAAAKTPEIYCALVCLQG